MSNSLKTLLFCELEINGDSGAWPMYSQWLSNARRFGLHVERAQMLPQLRTQIEQADALFLCADDLFDTAELSGLVASRMLDGTRTLATARYKGSTPGRLETFLSALGVQTTNRGIFPLDVDPTFDHPQSLYLREDEQSNALAQALLAGAEELEFSGADRLVCSEDWSPAFEVPREHYCDYLRSQDLLDLFPETGNPFFAATRCFAGHEPTAFVTTNPFMMNGSTSIAGYPFSGYRESRSISNRLLKWLAGDLPVEESANERIRAIWFRFESLLHDEVCRIMETAFGRSWPQSHLPTSPKQNTASQGGKQPVEDTGGTSGFFFVNYLAIIKEHRDIFEREWRWLAEVSNNQLKKDFGSLNTHIRNPVSHPARLRDSPISEHHQSLLQTYLARISQQR